MDLLSLALSLSLPMNEGRFTGDYSFDINPTFGIPFQQGLPWGAAATTLPGAVLYDARPYVAGTRLDLNSNPEMRAHELTHVDQQAALGPAFWLGYLATGGRAFEPYDPLHTFFGLPSSYHGSEHDMSQTWRPPADMPRDYPLFRIARSGDETRFQLLPGYPGIEIRP